MRKLRAFLFGVYEFRSAFTTSFGPDLVETYDLGREWAHCLTLRYFEQ